LSVMRRGNVPMFVRPVKPMEPKKKPPPAPATEPTT